MEKTGFRMFDDFPLGPGRYSYEEFYQLDDPALYWVQKESTPYRLYDYYTPGTLFEGTNGMEMTAEVGRQRFEDVGCQIIESEPVKSLKKSADRYTFELATEQDFNDYPDFRTQGNGLIFLSERALPSFEKYTKSNGNLFELPCRTSGGTVPKRRYYCLLARYCFLASGFSMDHFGRYKVGSFGQGPHMHHMALFVAPEIRKTLALQHLTSFAGRIVISSELLNSLRDGGCGGTTVYDPQTMDATFDDYGMVRI